MLIMNSLQFLISFSQLYNLLLKLFNFITQTHILLLEIHLLLLQFLQLYYILLNKNTIPVLSITRPLFIETLVHSEIQQLTTQMLVLFQHVVYTTLALHLRQIWTTVLVFLLISQYLLHRSDLLMLAFTPHLLQHQDQTLILIVQVLNLNLHLTNLSILTILLQTTDSLILLTNLQLQLLNYPLQPQHQRIIVLLQTVLVKHSHHLTIFYHLNRNYTDSLFQEHIIAPKIINHLSLKKKPKNYFAHAYYWT